jgi:flagellin
MTVKITNASAVNALAVLRSINKQSSQVQQQISTTYRIATAADDATCWSIASVMQDDRTSLLTINDALGLGAAKVDSTYTTMSSAIDVLGDLRAKLVAAREPGADKDKINAEITEYKNQLQTMVEATSFAGENWLLNAKPAAPAQWTVIGSFVRAPTGDYQAQTIDFPSSQTTLVDRNDANAGLFTKTINVNAEVTGPARNYHLLGPTNPSTGAEISISKSTTDAQIADMLSATDSMLKHLTTSAASIGVMKARIDDQIDYTADLADSVKKSVGALIDTDLDEASARERAIETQKQMGVEAFSILNSSASMMLILLE